jgi:hypothetical protein
MAVNQISNVTRRSSLQNESTSAFRNITAETTREPSTSGYATVFPWETDVEPSGTELNQALWMVRRHERDGFIDDVQDNIEKLRGSSMFSILLSSFNQALKANSSKQGVEDAAIALSARMCQAGIFMCHLGVEPFVPDYTDENAPNSVN